MTQAPTRTSGASEAAAMPMPLALRPYTPLRMVLTVCGVCFSDDPDREIDYETDILQGNLVRMDGGVYLRRICRRGHGEVMSLYEEHHDLWEYLQQWRTPTREIIPDTPSNARPIPMGYLDGLGDLQTQHSCILLIDVTEHCNLNCPTCFAASGTSVGRYARLPHILRSLDTAIEREMHERLGGGNRARHVHARAEDALARAGQHDRAHRVIRGQLAPGVPADTEHLVEDAPSFQRLGNSRVVHGLFRRPPGCLILTAETSFDTRKL